MFGLFYPYGIVLQAIAIAHFARRRPDTVLALDHHHRRRPRRRRLHPAGSRARRRPAAHVVPGLPSPPADQTASGGHHRQPVDWQLRGARRSLPRGPPVRAGAGMLRQGHRRRSRTRPIPSTAGRSPSSRWTMHSAAATDLEEVVERDPKYDYQRAAGLLAHALDKTGQQERGLKLFADTLEALDSLGNAVQLRRAARRAGEEGRGQGVGGARPAQEAHDAVATCGAGSGRGSGKPRALLEDASNPDGA